MLYSCDASLSEMRGLEYFCIKLAPSLGLYFDGDFWNRIIVQASVNESTIRHAMVAVGALARGRQPLEMVDCNYEHAVTTSRASPPAVAAVSWSGGTDDIVDPVVLTNYNKSMRHLAQHIAASSRVTETTLLACVLFVCVEFLRGDQEAARRHFQGGMAILMDRISDEPGMTGDMTRPGDSRTMILPIFNRLEMLSTLFGNEPSWPYPVSMAEAVPESFMSLSHARDSIVHLMNLSLRWIRKVYEHKYSPSILSTEAFKEQMVYLEQFQFWHNRFTAYRTAHAADLSPIDIYASNVLGIGRLVAKIWVSTALSPFECAHDAFMPDFETAISLAEQLPTLASMHDQTSRYRTAFTIDVEMAGPIHWISTKCRDPALRRRAVAVQRSTHRREGLWDSQVYAALAERVIEIEESGCLPGQLPSEEARVHFSTIGRTAETGASHGLAEFQMMPFGVYGEPMTWEELILVAA